MASVAKKTYAIRKNKWRKMGKKRKVHNRLYGSTPAFPIHVETEEKEQEESSEN